MALLISPSNSESMKKISEKINNKNDSIHKIVALSPHLAEILISVGGSDRLIAAPFSTKGLPAHSISIEVLGGIDKELMLKLQPDLILAWTSGNKASDLNWLKSQGFRIYKDDPKNIKDIAKSFIEIATLINKPKKGEERKKIFISAINKSCSVKDNKEVLVEIWNKPAIVLGGNHWINDALKKIGLVNTFKEINRATFFIEREALMSKENILKISINNKNNLISKNMLADLGRPGPDLPKALSQICNQYLLY